MVAAKPERDAWIVALHGVIPRKQIAHRFGISYSRVCGILNGAGFYAANKWTPKMRMQARLFWQTGDTLEAVAAKMSTPARPMSRQMISGFVTRNCLQRGQA